MSEPKLISPLLDGFAIGDALSAHDGVRCYPAMRDGSDDKYIVKVITIPASSVQLDALLLSGAYPDAKAAGAYFSSLVSDVENEVTVLRHFARLEGFSAYEGCQVVPTEDGVGFQIYLLGHYRHSLAKFFRSKPMTHLGAINLGIDLCAAMTVCRQAGCLYIDLKPDNIFVADDGRYQVGDLGFLPLSSLKYATVPDKYRSSYTAPELADPMAMPNTTVDIYAIGLILYQAYNNGALPFDGAAPNKVLPPPMYADYEMAEIILKACAPMPDDRWQDPKALGQALVAYMQRNGANDIPIVPPAAVVETSDSASESSDPDNTVSAESPDSAAESEENTPEDDLSFFSSLVSDETAPGEGDSAGLDKAHMTEELSDILAQAEDLLAHELPAPVVAPEPVEIPMPEPIVADSMPEGTDEPTDSESTDDAETENEELSEDILQHSAEKRAAARKTAKTVAHWLIGLVIAAGLVFGLYFFYAHYYLQTIDGLSLDGNGSHLNVLIDSETDDTLLTVICTDTYGTTIPAQVKDGVAAFTDLKPGSQYTVHVEISGFHKLAGQVSSSYATPPETKILSFTAVPGSEDGSVILSFTVSGQDSDSWTIAYNSDGAEEKSVSFTGHTVSISELTVGQLYTFRLVPQGEVYLSGTTELTLTAPKLVFAENLTVTAFDGTSLTVRWDAPTDSTVSGWTARCYNDNGYDVSMDVQACTATFPDMDVSAANTIEVTAAGMNQCVRTFVTANPISITGITGSNENPNLMTFHWDYVGAAPEGGWLLVYSIDNSDVEEVIKCNDNTATIETVIPGATYRITIQAANGATLLGGTFSSTVPESESFSGYGVSATNMEFSMCHTPDVENWKYYDLNDEDYTTTFATDDHASFLVRMRIEYNISYDDIVTLYVIRDSDGKIISAEQETRQWIDMWRNGYCELNLPVLPQIAGNYTVDIFFNGASVTTQNFTIE